jgi:hypothetical protein
MYPYVKCSSPSDENFSTAFVRRITQTAKKIPSDMRSVHYPKKAKLFVPTLKNSKTYSCPTSSLIKRTNDIDRQTTSIDRDKVHTSTINRATERRREREREREREAQRDRPTDPSIVFCGTIHLRSIYILRNDILWNDPFTFCGTICGTICGTVHFYILWNGPFLHFVERSIFTFCGTVRFYILRNSPFLHFVEHDEWDSGRIHIAGKWKHVPEKQY